MFDSLQERLSGVFDKLTRRGALSEADVSAALREVRVALLEADVALPVVRDFVAKVRERAVGVEVLRSVTPGQMVVKIVHDHLVETLGTESVGLDLRATAAVHVRLRAAAEAGAAVLVHSSDLDEVLELAGRVLVVSRGVVAEPPSGATASREEIGAMMLAGA